MDGVVGQRGAGTGAGGSRQVLGDDLARRRAAVREAEQLGTVAGGEQRRVQERALRGFAGAVEALEDNEEAARSAGECGGWVGHVFCSVPMLEIDEREWQSLVGLCSLERVRVGRSIAHPKSSSSISIFFLFTTKILQVA